MNADSAYRPRKPAPSKPKKVPIETSLLAVLNCIRDNGFGTLGGFLEAVFASDDHQVRTRVGRFFEQGGFRNTFEAMLGSSQHGSHRRITKTATAKLAQEIGDPLVNLMMRVTSYELEQVVKDSACRLAPRDMSPENAENFNLDVYLGHFAAKAPLLVRLLRGLVGVPIPEASGIQYEEDEMDSVRRDEDEEVPYFEDEVEENDPVKGKRRRRNKDKIVGSVVSQLIFGRSRWDNRYQTIIGFYLQACSTPKRVIATLNQIGLCVSYNSICEAIKSNGEADALKMKKEVASGRLFAWCWDNLVVKNLKAEETLNNRRQHTQNTSGYLFFLHNPDPGHGSQYKQCHENLVLAEKDNRIHGRVGIPRSLMFKASPDYSGVSPWDILDPRMVQEHFPLVGKVHIVDILRATFGNAVLAKFQRVNGMGIVRPTIPSSYYTVPVHRSELHVMPVMDLDESTIEGNLEVIERLADEIGVSVEELAGDGDVVVPCVGDHMTCARVESGKEMRIRDMLEKRMDFVETEPGLLHTMMAVVNGIFRCHGGRSDGMDPASLNRFIGLLGRTRVSKDVTDFNATHRFILQVLDAHVLAAYVAAVEDSAAEDGNPVTIQTLKDLSCWIEQNDWERLVDRVVDTFLPLAAVGRLKHEAAEKVMVEYEELRKKLMGKRKKDRTKEENALLTSEGRERWMKEKLKDHIDIPHYNALLFLQHGLLYRDLYTAARSGGAERIMNDMRILVPFFIGCRKGNYAREFLKREVEIQVSWTDERKWLHMNNLLLNLSGKPNGWMMVDENCEYVNLQLVVIYNPRDTWQSKTFQREHVARNIMTYRAVRRAVPDALGAPDYGSTHSSVNAERDVERVFEVLLEEAVMKRSLGRVLSGPNGALVSVQESIDAIDVGSDVLLEGTLLGEILQKHEPEEFPDIPRDAYKDLEGYVKVHGADFRLWDDTS